MLSNLFLFISHVIVYADILTSFFPKRQSPHISTRWQIRRKVILVTYAAVETLNAAIIAIVYTPIFI